MDFFFNSLIIYWILFSAHSSWILGRYKIEKFTKWILVIAVLFSLSSLVAALSIVLGWEGYTDISVYLHITYMPVLIPSPTTQPDVTATDVAFITTYTLLNGFVGWICARLFLFAIQSKKYFSMLIAILTTLLKLQAEIYVIHAAFFRG